MEWPPINMGNIKLHMLQRMSIHHLENNKERRTVIFNKQTQVAPCSYVLNMLLYSSKYITQTTKGIKVASRYDWEILCSCLHWLEEFTFMLHMKVITSLGFWMLTHNSRVPMSYSKAYMRLGVVTQLVNFVTVGSSSNLSKNCEFQQFLRPTHHPSIMPDIMKNQCSDTAFNTNLQEYNSNLP
jgi:hypothetical protein